MIWWRRNGIPDIPEAPEPQDRDDELAELRVRVAIQRAHSWRAISQTERTVRENHFGPRFAEALREGHR